MSNSFISAGSSLSASAGKSTRVSHQAVSNWNGFSSLFSKEKIILNFKSRHIWHSFLDVYKYSAPPTIQEAKRRIELNASAYYLQYSLIAALILILTVLSNGWRSIFVFSFIIFGILGILYSWPRRTHALILPTPFDGIQVSWHAAISLWAFISLLSILSTGIWIVFPIALGFSTFIIGIHGIFHSYEPNLDVDAPDGIV
ncbi:hypothetical protein MDAP_001525 [Mitosporidium daphniae]|uniref:PRA1 family protein n=1 Tax=Mitosporidium daphniae TaxID=1485682 RepID=A0A098VML3_9MICR|nr:uncharacterized protein DI09_90p20 [Mitosporidium daphniae]KGG50049.1 hypothetical protein DI09_90p20 [Mitosporidium daphniae]|eukprot:XP_013236490.1 uncharacterized protein DI09_90p20 [Mitosporidium daphniae]